jgi:hypothetical protein
MSEYIGLISILSLSLVGMIVIAGNKFNKMIQEGKMVVGRGDEEINQSEGIVFPAESKKLKSDFWDKISENH